MRRIAISYRRDDSAAICRAIFDRLTAHYGNESVFIDIERIPFGENFHDYIAHTLEKTDVLLVVVGPKWRGPRGKQPPRILDDDDPVRLEIETAAAAGTSVMPVLVQKARMPTEAELPKSLVWFAALNAAQVDEARDFDAHMAALIEAIDQRSEETRRSRSSEPAPNNIPHELSAFVGRKSELKHLQSLLRGKRLVSIVGPGGVGKTRLALQLARSVLPQFPGGAWFVPVSETLGTEVAVAVANAIGLEIVGRDPMQTVLQHLADQETLLILDDSEQYLDAIGTFASQVLQISSFVKLLVTSRERLHLRGEQVYALSPLQLPRDDMPLEDIRRCDAMRLLFDRAKANDEAFKISEKNAPDLIKICERLDGIPLALEFAAARLRTLSPHQVVQRLDEQFALLVSDKKDDGRHRTLRTAIEWSYNLLDDAERTLFARLAIFRSAFGIEAVEAICADAGLSSDVILDTLTALVEKSFVTKTGTEERTCFRLLHVIRSYAQDRLAEASDNGELEERYFRYYARRIETFAASDANSRAASMEELVNSHPDVIGALQWAIEHRREECTVLSLALAPFWVVRGFYGEGADILECVDRSGIAGESERALLLSRAAGLRSAHAEMDAALLDAEESVKLRERLPDQAGLGDALLTLGGTLVNAGECDRARALLVRALSLLQGAGHDADIAKCFVNLSICDTALRNYTSAQDEARQAVDLCERTGNGALMLWAHGALGNVAHQTGDLALARNEYQQSIEIARSMRYYFVITTALSHLAEVELLEGNEAATERCIEESLTIVREHNLSLQLPDVLEAAARLLSRRGNDNEAAQLFGSVDALRVRLKFPLKASERDARAEVVRLMSARHTDKWFEEQHARGASLDPSAVLQLARRAVSSSKPVSKKDFQEQLAGHR
jgi:predicted ATPase